MKSVCAAWGSEGTAFRNKLTKQSSLGSPSLINTDYHINLNIGQSNIKKINDATAVLEFTVSKGNNKSNLTNLSTPSLSSAKDIPYESISIPGQPISAEEDVDIEVRGVYHPQYQCVLTLILHYSTIASLFIYCINCLLRIPLFIRFAEIYYEYES